MPVILIGTLDTKGVEIGFLRDFLQGWGIDTLVLDAGVLQPPAFVNQYAAVPSLHFGWDLLIGIALVREAKWLPVRIFGAIVPALMCAAIVVTANHYIFDAMAGGVVAESVTVERPGLEDRFLEITGNEDARAVAAGR